MRRGGGGGRCLHGSHRRRHPAAPDERRASRSTLPSWRTRRTTARSVSPTARRSRRTRSCRSSSARALPGVEEVRDGTYRRSVRTADGSPAVIALTPDLVADHVTLDDLGGSTRWTRPSSCTRAPSVRPRCGPASRSMPRSPRPEARADSSAGLPGCACRAPSTASSSWCGRSSGSRSPSRGPRTSLGRFAARFGTPLDPPERRRSAICSRPPSRWPRSRPRRSRCPGAGRRRSAGSPSWWHAGRSTSPATLRSTRRSTSSARFEGSDRGPSPTSRCERSATRTPSWRATSACARGSKPLGLPATRGAPQRAERWRPWRAYAVMHLWHARPVGLTALRMRWRHVGRTSAGWRTRPERPMNRWNVWSHGTNLDAYRGSRPRSPRARRVLRFARDDELMTPREMNVDGEPMRYSPADIFAHACCTSANTTGT